MTTPPEFQGCDPVTEIRYATNGVPAEKRGSTLSQAALLAEHAEINPPTQEKIDHLNAACVNAGLDNPGKASRLAYTQASHKRYQRGIRICERTHRARKIESRVAIESAPQGVLSLGVVKNFGRVDKCRLETSIPENIKSKWPRDTAGDLCTDSKSLEEIDNVYSQALQGQKLQQRDRGLHNLPVDQDGRHRSWANPCGTLTGRDNPMGASFARLTRDQRGLFIPSDDHVLATLDYQQQEPAIAMFFAGDEALLQAYQDGDFYTHVAGVIPGDLSRAQSKTLAISFLYGATEKTLVNRQGMTRKAATDCIAALRRIFGIYCHWSDQYLQLAYANGRVASLDWQMIVHSGTPTRTVRNWPIQAAGADILRRVCLSLDDANIPVVGCLHDSVVLEIPIDNHQATITQAQALMATASAEVLGGLQLKTTVESVAFPHGVDARRSSHG